MLRAFCAIRCALAKSEFQRNPRRITGHLRVQADHLEQLTPLLEKGHIDQILKDDKHCSHLPDIVGHTVVIVLIPGAVSYYEDLQDLVSFTIEEPGTYYLHGVGEVVSGEQSQHASIQSYRQMLKARQVLREMADYPDVGKVIF
jgi:hypothetical protein